MSERTDVFIIGAGTAGNTAARALARGGRKVVVAEPDRVGGTCLWRGCMPKKALYHAAAAVRGVARAEQFGIGTGPVSVDWPGVLAWKWHAQETYAGDQDGILESLGVERITASARFTSPESVEVAGREISADSFIVATGAEPVRLPIPGGELADSSDDALRYSELPASLCIIGGGYIALEFAGIYASFGCEVTVLVRGTELLEQFDPDCVAIARKALEDIGVRFVTGANVSAIKGRDGDLKVEYTEGATEAVVAAERVLAAIGRRPAYGGIDLEKAGLRPGHNGRFAIDESLRSENPRIFFAGDAAAHDQHTPVANIHGRAVAQSILEGRVVQPDTRGVPFACFTAPELAQTGLTEAKARASGIEYDVHSSTFEYLGAAIISDVRQGLVKIIAEKGTGVVIGGHIAGERAADLIYPLSMAVRGRLTIQELQSSAAVHPAFSEIVNWAAY